MKSERKGASAYRSASLRRRVDDATTVEGNKPSENPNPDSESEYGAMEVQLLAFDARDTKIPVLATGIYTVVEVEAKDRNGRKPRGGRGNGGGSSGGGGGGGGGRLRPGNCMHMQRACRGVTTHTISARGEVTCVVICMEPNPSSTFQKFHAILNHANYLAVGEKRCQRVRLLPTIPRDFFRPDSTETNGYSRHGVAYEKSLARSVCGVL